MSHIFGNPIDRPCQDTAHTCFLIFKVYDLQSSVKGRAVIVKNISYEDHTNLKQRSNADWDAYRLENSLKRLRFKVKQYVNQSAEVL